MNIKPWTKFEVEFEDEVNGNYATEQEESFDDSDLFDDESSAETEETSGVGGNGGFTPLQVAELLKYTQTSQAPQAPASLSREQVHELLRRPKVTRETVDAVLGPRSDDEEYERAIKGLDLFVEMLSQHAMATAAHAAQYAQHGIQEQLTPLMAQREAQVTKGFKQQIETKFNTLQGKGKVVDMAISYLKSQNFQPKSQEDAIVQTAKVAARILQQADPNFRLGSRPVSSNNNGMNSFSRPSSGGGGSKNAKTKDPAWKQAFWG